MTHVIACKKCKDKKPEDLLNEKESKYITKGVFCCKHLTVFEKRIITRWSRKR